MRLVIARCWSTTSARLTAHLPLATRLLLVKADGWCSCTPTAGLQAAELDEPAVLGWIDERRASWTVTNKAGEQLVITLEEVLHDSLARARASTRAWSRTASRRTCRSCWPSRSSTLGVGYRLVRREYPTPIGPVDLLGRDPAGVAVAVEIKRRGEIDGVEQLTRYLELLNRDPLLAPVRGRLRGTGDQAAGPHARRGPRHRLRRARLRRAARGRRRLPAAVLS